MGDRLGILCVVSFRFVNQISKVKAFIMKHFYTHGHSFFFDIEFDICVFESIKGIELI